MNNLILSLVAGLGATLAIGVLSYAEVSLTEVVLLMAPFGATAVLVFGVPSSPLAQPKKRDHWSLHYGIYRYCV